MYLWLLLSVAVFKIKAIACYQIDYIKRNCNVLKMVMSIIERTVANSKKQSYFVSNLSSISWTNVEAVTHTDHLSLFYGVRMYDT